MKEEVTYQKKKAPFVINGKLGCGLLGCFFGVPIFIFIVGVFFTLLMPNPISKEDLKGHTAFTESTMNRLGDWDLESFKTFIVKEEYRSRSEAEWEKVLKDLRQYGGLKELGPLDYTHYKAREIDGVWVKRINYTVPVVFESGPATLEIGIQDTQGEFEIFMIQVIR